MPYAKCVTSEQQKALEELKSRVKNELASPTLLEDDALFYKFLKARGFNVDKAEKLLRKHIVWRQVHEVDIILETFKPKEVFVKYVEPSVVGFDKDGDIVTYVACGRINNTDLLKCIKLNDYIKHWIWFAEKLTSLNKQRGKKTGIKAPVSLIVDLDKLELANATSRETANIFLRLTHLIRENYAERLKAAYIINAPSFYVIVFSVIKAVMSNIMIQRIHVFGQNGWKEKFSEAIDADVLPAFLGGKRTDPDGDPYCKSFITLPGKIPESYYLSDKERYFSDPTKVSHLLIPHSEKREISVHVTEAGSLIRWQFVVMHKTIGFGLFYQTSTEYLKEIIPMYEYDTSDGTEENSYKCSSKGKYSHYSRTANGSNLCAQFIKLLKDESEMAESTTSGTIRLADLRGGSISNEKPVGKHAPYAVGKPAPSPHLNFYTTWMKMVRDIIIFDNSQSKFTNKEVQYIVSVQNPET